MSKSAPTIRDPESQFEREVREILKRINEVPILAGIEIKELALSATPVVVQHNLGRIPRGFFVTWSEEDVTVFAPPSSSAARAATAQSIRLAASATATVNIWIY